MSDEEPSMPDESRAKMRLGMKMYVVGSALVLASVMCGVGWVFHSRLEENRKIAEKAAAEKRAEDERTIDMLGGNRFDILNFYASPPIVKRGESVQLCYGVSNAKEVRLEPKPEAGLWPSFSRCLSVTLKKTTTYTLTAESAAGETKTATVTVEVQ